MGLYKTGNNQSLRNDTYSNIGNRSEDLSLQMQNMLDSKMISVRVTDIVLDENHEKFEKVGRWNGIGAIFYEVVNKSGTFSETNYALPYDSNLKTYPLINEIVLMFSLPNQFQGIQYGSTQFFYLKPLNLWNHPHHDAYPNVLDGINDSFQKRDYNTNGRQVTDGSTEIDLNSKNSKNNSQNTFVEKVNIKPLLPFMGDILMEGRYGQSIRFGSTAKSKSLKGNNWSSSGENGDPITIIRNGQPEKLNDDRGWIPYTEDTNKDLSSIYLTSKQKIPFNIANENFNAYKNKPLTPSSFILPQIIINSNRVILNAKTDSVLISGEKSVGLSSNQSINLESNEIYLSGRDIKLGNKNATEPVLLGNKTTQLLEIILKELINLTQALSIQKTFVAGIPGPDPVMNPIAEISNSNLNKVLAQINTIKSNFVKTK